MTENSGVAISEQAGVVALTAGEFERLARYAGAATKTKTRADYDRELTAFQAWCERKNRRWRPATPDTVALYLSACADGDDGLSQRRPSTLRKIRSVITKAHKLAGMADPCSNDAVKSILAGIDRVHKAGQVKRARPALAEDVEAMIEVCGDSPAGLRDAAVIALGYGAALRRAEIVALDVEDIEEEDDCRYALIRESKTDQTGKGERVRLPDISLTALDRWLRSSGITRGAIFRKFARGEHLLERRLTPQTVRLIILMRAGQAGLTIDSGETAVGPRKPTFSGHSLRRGAATQARINGADVMEIQKLGRWSGPAMPALYAAVKDWTADPNQRLGRRSSGDDGK